MRSNRSEESQKLRSFCLYLILCFLTPTLICGCVSHRMAVSPETHHQMLPFIQTNLTTRNDLVRNMGEPAKVFLGGKVWIYFLGLKASHDSDENRIVVCQDSTSGDAKTLVETSTDDECTLFHLIVSFNTDNFIERQTMVQVR
jgi:hypothetical protein